MALGVHEARTSALQAAVWTRLAGRASFTVEPGASPHIRFPGAGPYDARHGYTRIPAFTERLAAHGYAVEAQARFSPSLRALAALGLPPPVRETARAGLVIEGRRGAPLFSARPAPGYPDFDAIPRAIVDALVFVENRELLDAVHPRRNPALEWDRIGQAAVQYGRELFGVGASAAGGSTLATQIEKFRHSPGGITPSPLEKLRQIAAASLRAYRGGPDTRAVRRELVVDYLNSLPLAAVPGHGEVLGLRDGLEAWYGADFDAVNALLRALPARGAPSEAQAVAYAQALSLVLATQRPTAYLAGDPALLRARMETYLELLAAEGRISAALRDAAARVRLVRRPRAAAGDRALERKPASPVRARLVELLGLDGYPELDALDLRVESTLDEDAQRRATEALRALRDPARAASSGLVGFRLLRAGEGEGVVYSFSLYERGRDANRLLVQTDNGGRALDVSEDAKLDLGSTAKLRTLVSYLDAMAALHDELAGRPRAELRALPIHPKDRLSRFARDALAERPDLELSAFLELALDRRYTASPHETFFTGGGQHRFANFDRAHDARVATLREAFRDSINLPFVRLLRDLVDHLISRPPGDGRSVLEDLSDPRREAYLRRFADREARVFLTRFHRRLRGASREGLVARLFAGRTPTPKRLAVVLRSLEPEQAREAFEAEMRRRLGRAAPDAATLAVLYRAYGPDRLGLADRGYLAGVHPLELWLAAFLRVRPHAKLDDVFEASEAERIEVYRWLFRSRRKSAQDLRIRTELEREAFAHLHEQWRETGYPFDALVPSYATAIGSSADRPSALAELVGILLNDGVRRPTLRIERLAFGEGTPWETRFVAAGEPGRRVVRREVAGAVRGALREVVEAGTARRAAGALGARGGRPVAIGGKTGTGDHRFETFAPGGRLVESRSVSRTATFVFAIEDRFYGVVTAHVVGPAAERYGFTSSLPVQLFRTLAPSLAGPLLDAGGAPAPAHAAAPRAAGGRP